MIFPKHTIDFVISGDGTRIGYRQLGSGPGLILIHGGMMASQNYMKLAEALAGQFTVYVPDRRGRGLSGPHGANYSLSKESADMQALINKTKAENIFGLSSGALVALQTAIAEPTVKKLALYEPPIPVKGTTPAGWAGEYERALSEGKLGKAFITIVKGTADSSLLTMLPAFITAPLMSLAIKADAKEIKKKHEVSLKDLIPTIHYDIMLANESGKLIDTSKSMASEVLLLGGAKSQDYLKAALDALSIALPAARRVVFPGTGHLAPDNSGKPEMVANELRIFFTKSIQS